MKFEDLLMQQPSEEKPNLDDLQEEVEKLHLELDGEIELKRVLQCALQGHVHSCPCSSLMLPTKEKKITALIKLMQVKVLLTELKMVEEEIIQLERKVSELNLNLFKEQRQTKERELLLIKEMQPAWGQRQWHKKQLSHKQKGRLDYGQHRKSRFVQERRTSSSSSTDLQSSSFRSSIELVAQSSRYPRIYGNHIHIQLEDTDVNIEKPNKLSEELIKCLTDIFLRLNQASYEIKPPITVPKHTRSTSKSKGFMSKSSFTSCTSPLFSWDDSSTSDLDPYCILQDLDSTVNRDVGPYKNFLYLTRTSIDTSVLSDCRPKMRKLRVLMHELSNVDLTYLTYKQKLAFWINMYNACIMHEFLQHGFPTAQEKVLEIMNEAAINVGGVLMNALAIEHFILRHPSESKQGPPDEKEMLLRRAYGLGYPEPNVIFALCKGCWSSPALRVYTADEIVNELERAKVEYLEASIGTTNKKNILLPKLMQWHMRDFADDMRSLLEWIYSQLPQSGSLKGLIMECLNNGDTKSPVPNMIQIQPYAYEFRYILCLSLWHPSLQKTTNLP